MTAFQTLVDEQQEVGEEIQQLVRNYKKDSISRKTTKQYFIQRIEKLDALGKTFEDINNQIKKISNPPQEHAYFAEDYYDKIHSVVETFHAEFVNMLKSIENQPCNNNDGQASTSQAAIVLDTVNSSGVIRKLTALSKAITRQCDLTLRDEQTYPAQVYYTKLKSLEHNWKQLQELNLLMWENCANPFSLGYNEADFIEVEGKVQDTLTALSIKVNDNCGSQEPNSSMSMKNVQLPKITIPKFNGDYLKWQQFHDLFTEMIDKQDIPNSQKMWYLTTCLSGEAANLISHLPATNDNYNIGWKIVKDRYDNKRAIVSSLIQSMIDQRGVGHSSVASASDLRAIHDNLQEGLYALQNIGVNTATWGPILIYLMLPKLDRQTRMLYEQSLTNPRDVPTISELLKFLELRFQSLEVVGSRDKWHPTKSLASTIKYAETNACKLCNKPFHHLFRCEVFNNKSVHERIKSVQNLKVCFNCLRNGHMSSQCSSRGCNKCNKKHNTLLHQEESSGSKTQKEISSKTKPSNTTNIEKTSLCSSSGLENSYVLLGTAVVNIATANSTYIRCRAVLDSGSQVNLITRQLANRLQIAPRPLRTLVEKVGGGMQGTDSTISTTLQSSDGKYTAEIEALIMQKIVSQQPHKYFNIQKWKIPKNLTLADPEFNRPDDIDLLLGAEFYNDLLQDGCIKLSNRKKKLPSLQNTVFGWMCVGKIDDMQQNFGTCGVCSDEDLHAALTKLWQLDEVGTNNKLLTDDEKTCEALYVHNTSRNNDGRYVVKIPFKEDPSCLGNSIQQATNRFFSLERRLARQPDTRDQYIQFMQEYERLGHMERVNRSTILQRPHYFIPHHCVLKPDSSTTKLRVVFDASAKTSNGIALNDITYNGPVVQSELSTILLRFRMHRFVFTTDVQKMYRQIVIHHEHQQYQLIVWRESPNDKLEYFKLKTVTYGTRSAPYLATRCLKALADSNKGLYPLGAKALDKDFYVDDGLVGADSMVEILETKKQLTHILATAGLTLRKWCANNAQLLAGTPIEDQEIDLDFNNEDTKTTIKTLGILWLPKTDEFRIKTTNSFNKTITKRTVSSELARIYDPLGLVAPVIVRAKLFVQTLWRLKIEWDDHIPDDMQTQWNAFREDLSKLNNVRIPRHVKNHKQANELQLHVFSDASERAYGSAVYVRSINSDRTISVQLLCSKSRVAPLKTQTIPRLELCAALLAAELVNRVKDDLNLHDVQIFMWTDSEIVLHWINSEPAMFQTFVGHRISRIQELTLTTQWRHVPTKNNPADVLSRGISPAEINTCTMWFYGPLFLHGSDTLWPSEFRQYITTNQPTEERKVKIALAATIKENSSDMIYKINHKNSFPKLQRIVGYVIKFTNYARGMNKNKALTFTPGELNHATMIIMKAIQESDFPEEIKILKAKLDLKPTNPLAGLTPFIDEVGLLRVGGRLENSSLPFDAKHQILLAYNDPIAKMLMRHLHESNMHCGPQALLAQTRQRFWPIKGKVMARSVVQHCVRCTRTSPKTYQQLMGNLPHDRVNLERPFLNAGVDFCGPIWVHYKIRGKRPVKAYIAVFCCFATKAVHLEVVSDLTTEAFIGALNRFISRRGRCQKLHCDNATNFVGANNQLQELMENLYSTKGQEKIKQTCSNKGIEFSFIPPRAPHFGGLWEAAVKSAKYLLTRELGNASLTYEELETVVVQIEAILNSRPLTPLSADPNDLGALTPGHFLIGEPLTSHPSPNVSSTNKTLATRWRLVNHLKEEFWSRWSKEYLNELQHRNKWKTSSSNVDMGTMVIIKQDNMPPLHWPLGRITKVFKGSDGLVRVAEVQTSTGILKRPIHKLAPLFPENECKDKTTLNTVAATDSQQVSETKEKENYVSPVKRRKLVPNVNIITILAFICCLPLLLCSPIEVTKFARDPGIRFENIGRSRIITTNWDLLIYYNVAPLRYELQSLSNGTRMLQKLCIQIHQGNFCNELVGQFLHAITELESDNMFLKPRRKRRGAINIIGNAASALFGVLDSNYAEEMAHTIQNMRNNDHHIMMLLKNQTSLIDSTINVVKTERTLIKAKFDAFESAILDMANHIKKTDEEVNDHKTFQSLTLLSLHLMLITSNLRRIHTTIINVLTDVHHGQINPLLLSPEQLKEEIVKIKAHLPPTLQLPVGQNDVLAIYKIMTVEMGITENYILFKLMIPLISHYEFNIFKVIPVAVRTNNTLMAIKASTKLIAITDHGDIYYPMSSVQYAECTAIYTNNYLCPHKQSVLNKGSKICACEVHLFNNETKAACEFEEIENDQWVQLDKNNEWIYSVKTPVKLMAVCGPERIQTTVEGSGILKLQPNCILKHESFTIYAHQTLQASTNASFISHGSLSTLSDPTKLKPLTLKNSMASLPEQINDLQTLQKMIKDQQIFELPQQMQRSNYHSLGIGYLALTLVAIYLVARIIRQVRKNRPPVPAPRTQSSPPFTVHI